MNLKGCYRLGEVEDIISEMDTTEIDDDIVLTEDKMEIVISGWYVYISSLNLRLHVGIVGMWDEEMNGFMPDFAATILYEGKNRNEEYLYFEQGGFVSTVTNWLQGKMRIEEIEQLKCEVCLCHQ